MEAEQRIQALEQEVQILKNQIQSILLDIQTHLLTNAYPALRGHHTAGSPAEDEEDDDEYDRAAPAPKVRKVKTVGTPAKQEKVLPPVTPAEPMMASLDEQQKWVLQNIQSAGVSRTRDLISEYTHKRRFTPEVSDTLMRFTDMYAAAADEPTLPSRPAGMPTGPVAVKAFAPPPTRQVAKTQAPPPPPVPARQPVKQAARATVAKPKPIVPAAAVTPAPVEQLVKPVDASATAKDGEQAGPSSLVLRLIAGVQNAGAGVRWGKNKN